MVIPLKFLVTVQVVNLMDSFVVLVQQVMIMLLNLDNKMEILVLEFEEMVISVLQTDLLSIDSVLVVIPLMVDMECMPMIVLECVTLEVLQG